MDNFCIDCRVAMTKKEVRENQWRCDECQIKHEIELITNPQTCGDNSMGEWSAFQGTTEVRFLLSAPLHQTPI